MSPCLFERTLSDEGVLASVVLENCVHLIYNCDVDLLRVLRSLRIQAGEYAEIYGAPEDRVWRKGVRYKLLATREDLVDSAGSLMREPIEAWIVGVGESYLPKCSAFHDENGQLFED